jgi:hypothetical protein
VAEDGGSRKLRSRSPTAGAAAIYFFFVRETEASERTEKTKDKKTTPGRSIGILPMMFGSP